MSSSSPPPPSHSDLPRHVELHDFSRRSVYNRTTSAPSTANIPSPTQSPPVPPTVPSHPAPANDIISAQINRALYGTLSTAPSFASISTVSTASIPSETREELFRKCLGATTVDVDELRCIIWAHGTPSAAWARPLAWKLLTAYLPPDRLDWDSHLAHKRARYWSIVHDITVDPNHCPNPDDHPLSDAPNSQWREYFKDAQLRKQIRNDTARTHPDLHRFATLRDHLQRILFVYAKQHPSVGYWQGMNELAAPFLLVFSQVRATDPSDMEADAYFCFESIMDEMAPCYANRQSETTGIGRQFRELQALLRIKDPVLEQHLQSLSIDTRFYGLRWLRLWLAREFNMLDVLSLWDSFLTSQVRLPWIRYVCVAMMINVRERLLQGDFARCMKTLLNYPHVDIPELLRIADRLRTSNVVIVRTARR